MTTELAPRDYIGLDGGMHIHIKITPDVPQDLPDHIGGDDNGPLLYRVSPEIAAEWVVDEDDEDDTTTRSFCSFCEETVDSVTIGTGGVTACPDCMSEADPAVN